MLSFKQAFSLPSFTFIKRLFSSSSLSAIRVVSPAYLRSFIFLLAILILACTSSSLAFCMMYSAQMLNIQGDYIAWYDSFLNFEAVSCSMWGSNCCFLTCEQISQEAGKVVWYSHLFMNFSQFVVIHTIFSLYITIKTFFNLSGFFPLIWKCSNVLKCSNYTCFTVICCCYC